MLIMIVIVGAAFFSLFLFVERGEAFTDDQSCRRQARLLLWFWQFVPGWARFHSELLSHVTVVAVESDSYGVRIKQEVYSTHVLFDRTSDRGDQAHLTR